MGGLPLVRLAREPVSGRVVTLSTHHKDTKQQIFRLSHPPWCSPAAAAACSLFVFQHNSATILWVSVKAMMQRLGKRAAAAGPHRLAALCLMQCMHACMCGALLCCSWLLLALFVSQPRMQACFLSCPRACCCQAATPTLLLLSCAVANAVAAAAQIPCISATTGIYAPESPDNFRVWDGLFWLPQVVGACFFITSALLFMLEEQRTWYRLQPQRIGWHVGFWNLIGALGFFLSGVFGFWSEPQGVLQVGGTAVSTFWGAWAFLIGSYLQLLEALNT